MKLMNNHRYGMSYVSVCLNVLSAKLQTYLTHNVPPSVKQI